jgi:hypothetical protein
LERDELSVDACMLYYSSAVQVYFFDDCCFIL